MSEETTQDFTGQRMMRLSVKWSKKDAEQWGYQVVAIEAMQVLTTCQGGAQLVLMDIGLPSLTATIGARKSGSTSTVPTMFLSSRDQPMDIVMAINIKIDDYVTSFW